MFHPRCRRPVELDLEHARDVQFTAGRQLWQTNELVVGDSCDDVRPLAFKREQAPLSCFLDIEETRRKPDQTAIEIPGLSHLAGSQRPPRDFDDLGWRQPTGVRGWTVADHPNNRLRESSVVMAAIDETRDLDTVARPKGLAGLRTHMDTDRTFLHLEKPAGHAIDDGALGPQAMPAQWLEAELRDRVEGHIRRLKRSGWRGR